MPNIKSKTDLSEDIKRSKFVLYRGRFSSKLY